MIKKIIIISFLLLLSTTKVFGINIDSSVKFIGTNGNPLVNLVVTKSDQINNNTRYLVTDKRGELFFDFPYLENGNDISLNINGNSVLLQKLHTNNNKNIIIVYNIDKQKIIKVDYIGESIINNQQIVKLTNYKLLMFFLLFTIISGTIILFGRVSYMYAGIDVGKHKNL